MGSSRTTQETKIPEYLEEARKIALQQAQQIQQMGYMPYMGPEIAAVNPYEQAMAQNVGQMASAFGMSAPSDLDMGMPTVTQGGMTGYSSYPIYQSAMERLREQRPEQYDFFAGQTGFDPITGAATGYVPPTFNIGDGTGGVAPVTPVSSGGGDDGPAFAGDVHASNMAFIGGSDGLTSNLDTKGQIGKYSGSMQGMSPLDKIKSDVSYAKSTAKKDIGKLFGGLFGG
jgi:hypothetical protein